MRPRRPDRRNPRDTLEPQLLRWGGIARELLPLGLQPCAALPLRGARQHPGAPHAHAGGGRRSQRSRHDRVRTRLLQLRHPPALQLDRSLAGLGQPLGRVGARRGEPRRAPGDPLALRGAGRRALRGRDAAPELRGARIRGGLSRQHVRAAGDGGGWGRHLPRLQPHPCRHLRPARRRLRRSGALQSRRCGALLQGARHAHRPRRGGR